MKYLNAMLTHWSTYAGLVGGVVSFLTPSINAYVAAHPHAVAGVLLGAVVTAYHMSAPKDQPPKP